MYRGILLDFYGTLAHEDDDVIRSICRQINKTSPHHPEVDDIAAFWWTSFSEMCSRSYLEAFQPQRELAFRSLVETLEFFGSPVDPKLLIDLQFDHWVTSPLFEDSRRFLAEISMPVCIVSNIDRADIQAVMGYHRLQTDYLVTSDDALAYKPRREMFDLALKALELSPPDVLHVGDSRTSDILGARNAGIPVAWINRASKPRGENSALDFEVTSLLEVLEIVSAANDG